MLGCRICQALLPCLTLSYCLEGIQACGKGGIQACGSIQACGNGTVKPHFRDIEAFAPLLVIYSHVQSGTEHVLVILGIHTLHNQRAILWSFLPKGECIC